MLGFPTTNQRAVARRRKALALILLYIVFSFVYTLSMTPPLYAAGEGDTAVFVESTGLDAIGTTVTDIDWDTTDHSDGSFTLQGNNTDIQLNNAGRYLVMYSVPTASSGGSNRSEMQSWLRVNNTTDEVYGRGQGYIRRSGGADEGYNQGAAIINVSANDTVRVQMQRTDSNSATVERRAGKSGINLLKLNDAWDYLRSRPSTNQTIGSTTNFEDVTLAVDDEISANGYSRAAGTITLKNPGHYLITYNVGISHSSGSIRVNDETRLLLDGSEVPGSRTSTYMRGTDGTNDGMTSYIGIVETTAADTELKLQVRRESEVDSSNHQIKAAETGITIAKLPDSADYIRVGDSTGTQNLPTSRSSLTWNQNYETDPGSFTYNDGGLERIGIESAGDYLFLHGVYADRPAGNANRESQFLEWRANGSSLFSYGSSGQFNRGDQGSYDARTSGSSGGAILDALSFGDYIELTQINEASDETSTYAANRMAVQALNLTTLSATPTPATLQTHFRWRDDTTALNTNGGWITAEDTELTGAQKGRDYRLRIAVANTGSAVEVGGRQYQLQFADATSVGSCSAATGWTAINAASDEIAMSSSAYISPDGQSTTGILANAEGYTFSAGEGRDTADTTGTIGPLAAGAFTEIEYAITPTASTVAGHTYCFRVYDSLNSEVLDSYSQYPSFVVAGSIPEVTVAEYGTVTVSGTSYSTVNLSSDFSDMVVVASPRYAADADVARSARVTNKNNSTDSFDIKAHNFANSIPGSTVIDYLVFEAGSHSIDNGSGETKVIAGSLSTSDVWCNGNYSATGTTITFSPTFNSPPAVLSTVTSDNETTWVTSQVNDGSQQGEPGIGSARFALMDSFRACAHASSEDIDYVAIDPSHGTNNGNEFDAVVTADIVDCCTAGSGDAVNYFSPFSSAPGVGIVAQMGEDGGNGGFTSTHTANSPTTTTYYVSSDEDGPAADRTHTQEVAGLVTFGGSSGTLTAKLSDSVFDVDTYRFYDNANAVQPSSPIEAENTSVTTPVTGSIIRLRTSAQVGVSAVPASNFSVGLQYAQASTCSLASGWTDVGAQGSGELLRFADNAAVADGATITSSLLNGGTNTLQSYNESAFATNNPNSIAVNARGEWDWVIENNGINPGLDYCFRVTIEGAPLYHNAYPQIIGIGSGLSTDIVDGSEVSVASPSFGFNSVIASVDCQSTLGTFGTPSQRLQVVNYTTNPSWRLSLAASGGNTSLWSAGTPKYDFNDTSGTPSGCGAGLDADTYAGKLSLNPSSGTIAPSSGCTTTGISLPTAADFEEGVNDSLTLAQSSTSTDWPCKWELTDIPMIQTIPPGQPPDTYSIDMTITVVAE